MTQKEREERALEALIAAALRNEDVSEAEILADAGEALRAEPKLTDEEQAALDRLGSPLSEAEKPCVAPSPELSEHIPSSEALLTAMDRKDSTANATPEVMDEIARKREALLKKIRKLKQNDGGDGADT